MIISHCCTRQQLNGMKEVDIFSPTPANLVDIRETKIDHTLPVAERLSNYIEQIGNPYCFLCGKTPVRLRFSDNGKELGSMLKSYFTALREV